MSFHVAGFLLAAWLLFWGAGAALLLTPRRWRRAWILVAPTCGTALASAVVWIAARHTLLPGAQAYAHAALLLPLGLLVLGVRRRGGWREAGRDLARSAAPLACAAVVLAGLLSPLPRVADTLTSVSLGSCDAADYAAGARVLGEHARDDRSGYLGHTEVVREHSVDNFFDYWLRLNHFTPSALLALANATFGWDLHESVTLLAAVLVATTVPLVFWLARAVFGLAAAGAVLAGLLYGLSPLTWYGVWHTAIGQSLAAAGIGLLTWAGMAWWREGADLRRLAGWAGLIVTAFWILFGSFNFIVLICLAPAAAWVTADALRRRRGLAWLRWVVALPVLLLGTGLLFSERLFGLAERFLLFAEHDFGWRIAVLWLEGWLGLVARTDLTRLGPLAAWTLTACIGLLSLVGLWRMGRLNPAQAWRVAAVLAPVVTGYVYLQLRARWTDSNESYDAYKVLVVFYPVVLPALLVWLTRTALTARGFRVAAYAFGGFVLAAHAWTAWQTTERVARAPLVVTPSLAAVRGLEARADVTSVNLLVDEFWSRLWSNAFLLGRPQYFQGYTYEGRRGTALKGDWDLNGGLVELTTDDARDGVRLAPGFTALRVGSPVHVRVALTDGWYDLEQAPHLPAWRWTRGTADLLVDNPQAEGVSVALTLDVGSFAPRDLQVWLNDSRLYDEMLAGDPRTVQVATFHLPPGRNRLRLTSGTPAVSPGPGDTRELGFIITRLSLHLSAPSPGR